MPEALSTPNLVALHITSQELGPVHMEASQPAYRAGGFCRDLSVSLFPIQSLFSVHMSRRAGPVGEISLEHCRDPAWRDEIFPYEHSSPLAETKLSLLRMCGEA